MKILLLAGFILLPIVVGCDGNPNATSWPLQQPEESYEVDAWGSNPDLLEFTPKGNSEYFCILAISGSDKLKGIFCMPKASK